MTGQAAAPTFDANGNQTKTHTNVVPAYNAKDQTSSFTPPGASAINLTYADADSTEMTAAGPASLASGLRGLSRDARSGGSTYRYVRDSDGKLVARRSSSPSQHYYLFDGLGSVVGLATTSGALANSYRYTYDPFGNQTSATPALGNPWGYAGGLAMDDITTGTKLIKFGTRYYDPSAGRWTQQDPVAGSIGDPGTVNRYMYAGGDPINRRDLTGYSHYAEPLWVVYTADGACIVLGGLIVPPACPTVHYVVTTPDGEENWGDWAEEVLNPINWFG